MTDKQKDLVKRWVAALRSGKYIQGGGALKTKRDRYCCLGVLCDVVKEEVGGRWKDQDVSRSLFIYKGNERDPESEDLSEPEEGCASVYLPEVIREIYGLRGATCKFDITPELKQKFPTLRPLLYDLTFADLIHLNDTLEFSFQDIADLLEAGANIFEDEEKSATA